MKVPGTTAAERLEGVTLGNGWQVDRRVLPGPSSTGGNFSVGYTASHADGIRRAFVKAADFERFFNAAGVDVLVALQKATEAHIFERDILKLCRQRRLSRVATAIEDGYVTVAGYEPLHTVFYLLFDLAAGDVRSHIDRAASFEVIWRLATLHQVATALRQLHSSGVVHQDLKPSNVLEFAGAGCRVGDFGRASLRGTVGPFDGFPVAGDWGYAPPEQMYGYIDPDWNVRRLGCDAYLLGCLAHFFFAGTSITGAVIAELHPGHQPSNWSGTFGDVLPYWRQAFDVVMNRFSIELATRLSPNVASSLYQIVAELCEPDLAIRGSLSGLGKDPSRFGMERYITRFDVLAKQAWVDGLR